MYLVLARKWRPAVLDELIGQEHVARTLRNAIDTSRVAHAYLFAGVRGTGKTTVARILGKCLNCESGPTSSPCGRCTPCVEIAEGRSLDVLELDAASRTGVDDIRELQEFVAYAPVRDRHKVLIIDEVHMLSKNAFNALLKTLEEPPARVVFVLATTELQKVLATILSRCQIFEFRRVAPREVAAHLRKICDAEGISISDRAIDRVARAGEGSVRDSLSVLERVIAFCGTDVQDDEALQVLGSVRLDVLEALVAATAARDGAGMLGALDRVAKDGHDLVSFWSELVGVLRDLLLMRAVPDRTDLLARTPEDARVLAAAAEPLSDDDLLRVFHMLADLEFPLRSSAQPRFVFEACLLRMAALGRLRPIEEILAGWSEEGTPSTDADARGPARTPTSPSGRAPAGAKPSRQEAPSRGGPEPSPAVPPQKKKPAGDDDASSLREALLAALHEARPMVGSILEQSETASLDGDQLTIGFPPDAEAVRRMVESEDNSAVVRRCAAEVIGREVRVRFASNAARSPSVFGRGGHPHAGAARGPIDQPRTEPTGAQVAADEARGASLVERVRQDPAVRRLLVEFGAQIIDVRPLEAPTVESDDETSASPGEEPA